MCTVFLCNEAQFVSHQSECLLTRQTCFFFYITVSPDLSVGECSVIISDINDRQRERQRNKNAISYNGLNDVNPEMLELEAGTNSLQPQIR